MSQIYNATDIATVRQALQTPSGERILTAVKEKNTPAYLPDEAHDAVRIAFRAAYNQGYDDALKYLRDILETPTRIEDMRSSTFQSPND